MNELRSRQVHLDFHTSEKVPDVGANFDPQQFAEMLQLGRVNSITLFSKCHHGLSYHDTSVGVRHPTMHTELLPRQLEVCRTLNIKTPIYLSAGIDEASIHRHADWAVKFEGGVTFDPVTPGFKLLCFNTPYLDYLCAQIDEVIEKFDGGDGIFLDIVTAPRCYCTYCVADMQQRGIDIRDGAAIDVYANEVVLQNYYERTTAACRRRNPGLPVFHNGGHIPKGARQVMRWYSHLELESLPTGGWGYDHFPVSAKYAATTGMEFLGMTGKFHTTWGEFGGFKRANALRYECAAMQAFGAKCSIGDQLHPSGRMNPDTYALIGEAYREVESREEWCREAVPVSEVAVVSPEALHSDRPGNRDETSYAEEGVARMLLEMQVQFDVVDLDRDLMPYRLVILPDTIVLDGAFADKMRRYMEQGGKVLLSGRSGMNAAEDGFELPIGLEIVGRSPWNPDYLVPTELTPTPPVRGPFVIHGGAWDVQAQKGQRSDILAQRSEPYFNRTWEHFCSHRNTPDARPGEFAGVIGTGNAVYFAHEIFTRYRHYGQPLYRDLVHDAITYLLGDLSLTTELPTAGRASLMYQQDEARYVLHLLYASPVVRGAHEGMMARALNIEIIEDIVPLYHIRCRVRVPEEIEGVRLVPSGEPLEWQRHTDGSIHFIMPKLHCHQMIELAHRK